MKKAKLAAARVLHWTGTRKPWKEKGLYKTFWRPHLEQWNKLLPGELEKKTLAAAPSNSDRPLRSGDSGALKRSSESGGPSGASGPTSSGASSSSCSLVVEDPAANSKACVRGLGCNCSADGRAVAVQDGCRGLFTVQNKPTFCLEDQGECTRGTMPKPVSTCNAMYLSTFFVGIKDWQNKRSQTVEFAKVKKFYFTSASLGMNVTMLHDDLPDNFVTAWQSPLFHFIQVDVKKYKKEFKFNLGVNDVRYFPFVDVIRKHPEWQYVFVLDGFDVLAAMNPCPYLQPGKLYVGSEPTVLKRNAWLKLRFEDMGGEYLKWYSAQGGQGDPRMVTLNCGITGGQRDIVLRLFKYMQDAFLDEKLKIRSSNAEVNVNMAALNWVVYRKFSDILVTGEPVHSKYWKLQNRRKDVWFIHK